MNEPIEITASEIIRRMEEKNKQMNEYYKSLSPLEKVIFLDLLNQYAQRMFYSGGPIGDQTNKH